MKEVRITVKNFYTQDILKQTTIKTEANTLKELILEQNYIIQDYIIFSKTSNAYLSENNCIEDNMDIVLVNANGQNNNN